MARKKAAEAGKRRKKVILLEVKKEIIRKYEGGMRLTALAKEYGRRASTIATILKMKEKITGRDAAKGVTRVSKQRPPVLEEVEKLLLPWIEKKQRAGHTVTEAIICAKAKALYADLLGRPLGTSAGAGGFKASRGWFDRFKARSGIRSVVRHGGAASSDVAAEEFAAEFLEEVMVSEGYLPPQVFNRDETGIFRKRLPKRTFITEEETSLPSQKPTKEHLTLLVEGYDRELTIGKPVELQKAAEERVSVEEEEETNEGHLSPRELKEPCQIDCGVVARKKASEGGKRKKEVILLEVKKEIIRKYEGGMRLTALAKEYGKRVSTVATILKMKEKITGRDAAKGVTRISKKRPPVLDEVEKLLLPWIEEKQRAGHTVTEALICGKAKALHADLLGRQPGMSADAEGFKASRGWFDRFKARSGIRRVLRHGEAAGSDVAAAEKFAAEFLQEVMASEGYLPPRIFNRDEPGIFRKRMPRLTFVTEEETSLPGHKPAKDRLALLMEGQDREQTPEEPVELQKVKEERVSVEAETNEGQLSSRELTDMCKMWVNLQTFVQQHHPDKVLAQRLVNGFDTGIMSPFRGMLKDAPEAAANGR